MQQIKDFIKRTSKVNGSVLGHYSRLTGLYFPMTTKQVDALIRWYHKATTCTSINTTAILADFTGFFITKGYAFIEHNGVKWGISVLPAVYNIAPNDPLIEYFNNIRTRRVVAAQYQLRGRKIWVRINMVINRRQGYRPFIISVNSGHYKHHMLVYVDTDQDGHDQAIHDLADALPHRIESDPDSIPESRWGKGMYYGINNPVFVPNNTIALCTNVNRVNYHAHYDYLSHDGTYQFPKERSK